MLVSAVELVPSEVLLALSPVVREDAVPLCTLVVSENAGVVGEVLVSPEEGAVTVSPGTEKGDSCAGLVVSTAVTAGSEGG